MAEGLSLDFGAEGSAAAVLEAVPAEGIEGVGVNGDVDDGDGEEDQAPPAVPEEFMLDPEAIEVDSDLLLFNAAKAKTAKVTYEDQQLKPPPLQLPTPLLPLWLQPSPTPPSPQPTSPQPPHAAPPPPQTPPPTLCPPPLPRINLNVFSGSRFSSEASMVPATAVDINVSSKSLL